LCPRKEAKPTYAEARQKDHGRIEIRRCWVVDDPAWLRALPEAHKWSKLRSLVRIQSERRLGGKSEQESRYYISSLPAQASHLLQVIRTHWQVENALHWVLDVAFGDDLARTRTDHSAHNLALLRHIALNLLKQERSSKVGVKTRRLRAGWDNDYLLKFLTSATYY
jgi:predicted transposase YbfD/YdcC